MKSSEIRSKYLQFFAAKGHQVLPGSSLIPADPTVLFTLAGMLQFKPAFLGQEKPKYKRVATVQKCLRTIDIDQVGKTPRHQTFFEMLGNFSFGDYFKKEAIQFAWELLVKEFKLPVTKLRIAVFEKDEEAFDLWRNDIGLPEKIISRLGEDNNFWAAGPTGPCGPCSEIYYDLGEDKGCGQSNCAPGCDCERFLEIWNLVFIQYQRDEAGKLLPLKKRGIDTGMGLERIASVIQGVGDNFATDLFFPLIKELNVLTGREGESPSSRIIVDHLRAAVNLVAEGIFPGNAGREYVLRRLIRRAVAHGRKLGINRPFLNELSPTVIKMMGDPYPELIRKAGEIRAVIKDEEENFFLRLEHGLKLFAEILTVHAQDKRMTGKEAFKLHDTYGFPLEMTVELAAEQGVSVDLTGFEKEMAEQKERARKSGLESDKRKLFVDLDLSKLKPTKFTGYEKSQGEEKIIAIFPSRRIVVLEKTPFYGESGGQVGDTGIFAAKEGDYRVVQTMLTPGGVILHQLEKVEGLKEKEKVKAMIDLSRRQAICIHHTATHLLHRALREVLGEHIRQAGSYVGPEKLRFDFTHFHGLGMAELQKIEALVNQKIKENLKVEVLQKNYQEALEMGAVALFGEKYGDKVRVLKIGDYSLELCGGTHVKNTSEIVFFKILSESALGSGLRRIEAVAGQNAKIQIVYYAKAFHAEVQRLIARYTELQREKEALGLPRIVETNIFEIEVTELDRLSHAVDEHDSVNVNKFLDHLTGRVEWLRERIAKAEKELASHKERVAVEQALGLADEALLLGRVKLLLKELTGVDAKGLRVAAETLHQKLGTSVVLLTAVVAGKVSFVIMVSEELVAKGISAKKIADLFTPAVEGRGGGRDTRVEGGGKNPAGIVAGLTKVSAELSPLLL